MSVQRRVQLQPAFILHHRPFRDSSQILDIVTRDHGKVSVVARGSRGSKSRLAGLLRPFLPLRVSWVAKSDLGTLTGAEVAGLPHGMTGDTLLSAYYVNELMLNLLHRYDPQPEIYALYAEVLQALAASDSIAASLRSFEIEFLSLLGYAINLDHAGDPGEPLQAENYYEYRIDQGLVAVERRDGGLIFDGATLMAIAAQQFDDNETLRAANRLLREVVAYHLDGKELKSRRVLMELHRGRIAQATRRK